VSLLLLVATVAFGWLLAVGVETKEGWRPPIRWWGWHEVHPLGRGATVLFATWLFHTLLIEDGRPSGNLGGIVSGLAILQMVLAIVVVVQFLRWIMYAHTAHALLRATGLTDEEIFALHNVNGGSSFEELTPALSGFQKLGTRVAAVETAFTASRTEGGERRTPAAERDGNSDPKVYSISDLIRYYVLSGNGKTPGVWQDCYLALRQAYQVPADWERDQLARMHGNEWRDQETPPEQRPYNLTYAEYRLAFERVRLKPMGQLVGPGAGELDQAVHRRLIGAISSLDAPLRELDRAFFAGVYGAPAALTFVESTLVVHYGFPDAEAQAEYWAASL
jgi:hypothetical protein